LSGSITPTGSAGSATGSLDVAAPPGIYGTVAVYFDDTQPPAAALEVYLVPFASGHDDGFSADEEILVAKILKTESDGTDESLASAMGLANVDAAGSAGSLVQFLWTSGNMKVKVSAADPTGAIKFKIHGLRSS
jgi:hypothetical protein